MHMMHAQCMTFTKPTAQRWGEAIREARTSLRLSIFELAARTGMDPGHLSRAERGLAGIGDDYRIALAGALGKRVEDLFPYPESGETACLNAASATAGGASPTPATTAARRSTAPSAEGPAASAREGSPGDE